MTAPVPGLSCGTLAEDVFKKTMTCQDVALTRGTVACVYTAGTDLDVVSPDNASASAVVGLVASAGTLTNGAYSAPALGDPLTIQRFGQGVGLLAPNQTITRGQKLGAISGTGGQLGAYIPGQGMKFIGFAAQSKTTTSIALFIEVDLNSNPKVVTVEKVSGFASTTFQNSTKYLSAPGTTTAAAAQVVLGVVPPGGGVLANLVVDEGTAPGGSDTDAFTVQTSVDHGATWVNSTLTATVTGAAKSASDVTHTPAVTAGMLLAIAVVASATSLGAGKSASFQILQQP